ncbi:HD domain-containing phosphohydrolase [Vibrio quintilis]|uniref:Virulence sensor protein BvgS n=1 Tax=Vibrio quintilis TaxID=1117707 RepID=A0A1M7YVK3_9VIBR|nr:HD domain-containing phosphohydrolase [Vibrio quintilis]SHO56583.1 Virulence sensor protein BvgS precursor [Vibrio quintilis]
MFTDTITARLTARLKQLKYAMFSIKMTVMFLFIVLSLLIITVSLSLQYYFSQHLAKESANILFSNAAQRVSDKIYSLDVESSDLALLLSQYPEIADQDSGEMMRPITGVMVQAMQQKPYLYAIYIGYEDGNFYELINLNSSDNLRETLQARPSDRWLIVHIHATETGRFRDFIFLDTALKPTHQRREPSKYFANIRPWYRDAMTSDTIIKTDPYIFHNTQSPGTTYAKRIPGSKNVIAVDITLDTLSAFLKKNNPLEQGNAFIFDQSGKVYAHSFSVDIRQEVASVSPLALTEQQKQYIEQAGTIRVSNEENWPPFDFSYSGHPQGFSIDLMNLIARKLGLKIEYVNGYSWDELVALYQQRKLDVLHSLFYTEARDSWGLFSIPYLKLSPVLVTREDRIPPDSLEQFTPGQVVAIPAGWAFVQLVKEHFSGVKVLEVRDSLAALKAVRDGQADAAFGNDRVVRYFIDRYSLSGLRLQMEHSPQTRRMDQRLRFLVHSDQGELQKLLNLAINSLTPEELNQIENRWLGDNASAKLQRAISSGVVPAPAFMHLATASDTRNAIAHDIMIGEQSYTIFVHRIQSHLGSVSFAGMMVPTAVMQKPYMEKVYYSLLITLGLLMVVTPVLFSFANMIVTPVNMLAEENQKIQKRRFKAVKHVPSHIREINDLSLSILSMADSIEDYQRNQQELVDSFIQLIAQAIDEKSPYTGGHCARVPELAIMLAEAAEKSDLPAFRSFKLTTEEQWREFRVAAWLHDCGKVTTPEYIIDKGSKLETIYNRIHEIRMRFEVLWRDAEIEHWQRMAAGQSEEASKAVLIARHQQIRDDFAFIAQCNVGSDNMGEKDVLRIQHIARQVWMRHLDNRLGLSPEEARQIVVTEEQPLPVREFLLADSPEHLIPWAISPRDRVAEDIRMEIPEYQANLGEIYNLSVRRGTLTHEDRFRINEHIIATIHMLDALPFPDELSRVPEIAGGHHEKLDGTGYPKQLTADELSMEARILAIADVFEALTASDRPYKNMKTLSKAIGIMAKMVQDNHLDGDLFKLFLSGRVYARYAERFLEASQCDEVDIYQYLGIVERWGKQPAGKEQPQDTGGAEK